MTAVGTRYRVVVQVDHDAERLRYVQVLMWRLSDNKHSTRSFGWPFADWRAERFARDQDRINAWFAALDAQERRDETREWQV